MYIGESEDVGERIRNHDTKLDWWTKVILITTSANNLHKAHVKYLESRLVEEARRAGRFKLMNGNTPPRSSLSEGAKSNMEQFVEHVLLLLPAIRVDGFLLKIRPQSVNGLGSAHTESIPSVEFQLRTPRNGVAGTAKLEDGEFVVQPGSVGRMAWEGAPEHNYKKLFDEVVANGVFIPEGMNRVFKEAYAFTSPSAAGAVLILRNAYNKDVASSSVGCGRRYPPHNSHCNSVSLPRRTTPLKKKLHFTRELSKTLV
ncbi:MAG TPA: GIY-YIG nuclease family protein [Edaphobacter sp.]|nr:GIY-YIG nuclease family protein [Edaphobacter sp.]